MTKTISNGYSARSFMKYSILTEPDVYSCDPHDEREFYLMLIMDAAKSYLDDISFAFDIPTR